MGDTGRAHHLVLVPHTHWDREWYLTHEQFRLRLIRLVDRLLDVLETDPGFRHFTLDGQSIVVDDYLAVRPEARERICKLVETGRLLVGPWTVLPDEWLVSGEALVRNLRNGLARADALGGAMRLGYVPDQFGHVGQLPQIFAGFGFEAAVLWRGVGDDVTRTLFRWQAPDGTTLLTVYLPHGYGNAAHLPGEPGPLAQRLERETRRLADRSPVPTLLLMNGTDHAEPRAELASLLEAARVSGASVEIGTLPGFVDRVRAELAAWEREQGEGAVLELHRGELRSGLRAPLLPGCASARMPQKRADFENDRLLVRYLEPLAAWWGSLGGDADRGLLDFIWRIALENHPHDSICGCSVDAVHDEMDVRFARVRQLAEGELDRVFRGLAARVEPARPGRGGAGLPAFVAWNPGHPGRAPAEVTLELEDEARLPRRRGAAAALHVRGADGRRCPSQVELLEPREAVFALPLPPRATRTLLGQLGPDFLGYWTRDIQWGEEDGRFVCRVFVGRAPGDAAALDAKRSEAIAAAGASACEQGHFELLRSARVRARFVDEWPGHGLRAYRLAPGRAKRAPELRAERLPGGGAAIANGFFRVEAGADGRVALVREPREPGSAGRERVEDAVRLVSEGDRGDEYNFDPVRGGDVVERPERVRVALERASAADVALRVRARYRVPAGLAADRARRSDRRVWLPVELRVRLHAGVDRVDFDVALDNTARDHRLRVHLRAPWRAERFEVESAFELADRPLAPDPDPPGAPLAAERPIGAGPQRGFATLAAGDRAQTVATRGLAEVDAVHEPDGGTSLALTLLRAVGWLSRADLWLRPMHAGPPFETPGAQVPGRHTAAFSLRWHPRSDPWRTAEAHRFAAPPVAVQSDAAADGPALRDGAQLLELDDPKVVVSAVEPRPGRRAVVRLYRASFEPGRAVLRWGGGGAGRFEGVTLDERPDPALALETAERGAVVGMRPWQIATLRVS